MVFWKHPTSVSGVASLFSSRRFRDFVKSGYRKKERMRKKYARKAKRKRNARASSSRPSSKRVATRVSRNASRISKLQKAVAGMDSVLKVRSVDSTRISAGTEQSYQGEVMLTKSGIETAMANGRFYNPSVPGTLITADLSTGTYSRIIKCRGHQRMRVANNTTVGYYCDIYVFECKDDSDTLAGAAWDAGLTDVGGLSSSSSMSFIEDSALLKSLWRKKLKKTYYVAPGEEVSCSWTSPYFLYNPANKDVDTDAYQRSFHTFEMLAVLRGKICHSAATTTNVKIGDQAADVSIYREYEFRYDSGGPPLKYIVATDNQPAVSDERYANMPISDIQTLDTT